MYIDDDEMMGMSLGTEIDVSNDSDYMVYHANKYPSIYKQAMLIIRGNLKLRF